MKAKDAIDLTGPRQSKWVLVLIGVEKLTKASLMVFVAIQAHRLILSPDAAATVQQWVHQIRVDPENRHLHALIARVTGLSHRRLWEISLGSYLYASLYIVEGVGLILKKRWAEWLTAIMTAIFIPLEVYELFRAHHHVLKVLALVINIAIAWYLFARLRRERAI